MKQSHFIYFTFGGFLLLTSGTAFLYFTLFNYPASFQQWASALLIGGLGAIFLGIGNERGKRS